MDSDGRIIHVVEDDQGEGMKDPLTLDDITFDDLLKMEQKDRDAITKEVEKQKEKHQKSIDAKRVIPIKRKVTHRRGR